jgi:hypothetical protein
LQRLAKRPPRYEGKRCKQEGTRRSSYNHDQHSLAQIVQTDRYDRDQPTDLDASTSEPQPCGFSMHHHRADREGLHLEADHERSHGMS